uniref:substrate-binding domain-containing protein n=1 Tax=Microbispora cellulosiformans TaxID=2614688 RepID=UPI001CD92D98|nr:substrate-binding domain-containing protein [Microbispora cellulosiformans]
MQAEVALHKEISKLTALDAEGKDDKQISDIAELQAKGCDALIVSPNTTATLTPAVKGACAKIPVIVFDRGQGQGHRQ